jgi:serine/threonine-protein phosphatase PP1 catalytic subunit
MASADQIRRRDRLITELLSNSRGIRRFNIEDARMVCNLVAPILASERTLLRLDAPIKICGDIHGQFLDLMRVFESGKMPPQAKYLFLGDYVDRGDKSVEVILLLFALKIKFPNDIFLIRGNHESEEMTELFGFKDECKLKLNVAMWRLFLKVFSFLPLGAVVGDRMFCIHGGLSPSLRSLADIESIQRPIQVPEEGLIADLLWSDPDRSIAHWGPNDRGSTICWGIGAVNDFLKNVGLSYIVRGHQLAMQGYDFPFHPLTSVVTIFTASKYGGEFRNRAAYLSVDANFEIEFHVLPNWVPHLKFDDASVERSRPSTARRWSPMREVKKGRPSSGR